MNNKKRRKIISMILMITVFLCNINYKNLYAQGQEISATDTVNEEKDEEDLELIETEDTDCEDETFEEVEETKRIELHTEITAKWDHHYNANVTITNLSDTRIDDWEITVSFQKINHKKVALTKGVQVLYQVDEEKVDRR